MNDFTIRPLNATDDREVERLYEICLQTGDNGKDASALHNEPDLLGTLYVGQYAALAPEFCFVLVDADDEVQGYAVGTDNSVAFDALLDEFWWPDARRRFPLEDTARARTLHDQRLVSDLHSWSGSDPQVTATHPAHFHIDLLPCAQGNGNGRKLLMRLLDEIRNSGAHSVHLGVSEANNGALGFYSHLGFKVLQRETWGYYLGMPL